MSLCLLAARSCGSVELRALFTVARGILRLGSTIVEEEVEVLTFSLLFGKATVVAELLFEPLGDDMELVEIGLRVAMERFELPRALISSIFLTGDPTISS